MYGDLQGIAGKGSNEIEGLEMTMLPAEIAQLISIVLMSTRALELANCKRFRVNYPRRRFYSQVD
jgi:hypothetical protein